MMWIPENLIIRNVEQFLPGNHGKLVPSWLDQRIIYSLTLLVKYVRILKPIQSIINQRYANGM